MLKPVNGAVTPALLTCQEQFAISVVTTSVALRPVSDVKEGKLGELVGPGIPVGMGHSRRRGPVTNSVVSVVRSWPAPIGPAALVGPIGEAVDLIAPHTESDPAAVLVQTLIGFGNVVGRNPYWRVEADDHHTNLFGVLVGKSGAGRKGTSWGHARGTLRAIDPSWDADRQLSGLSSGEGLIAAVQDDAEQRDKRLMVVEPEFARVLRGARREGNTLSAIIRQCWDSGSLRVATRTAPLAAKGAHISMIAHITEDELTRELGNTDVLNGFANRFLWVCVRRSRVLPLGGRFDDVNIAPLTRRLQAAAGQARGAGRLRLTRGAERLWVASYEALSDGRPGLYGAATGRAEAQTMRLALVYALAEEQSAIDEHHLRAALEVWRYCSDSARYLFGAAAGDHIADTILALIDEHNEATRTQIRDALGRNATAERITAALGSLEAGGVIELVPTRLARPGRPAETWRRRNDETMKTRGTG